MVRLFHVYYPVRTLVLLTCEALIVCASFLVAMLLRLGQDSFLVLNYEGGWIKIVVVSVTALLCSYYFDLYAPQRLGSAGEIYFRLLMVVAVLSFLLAGIGYLFPSFMFEDHVFLFGLIILTAALLVWRAIFLWMVRQSILQERVYVVGGGERAKTLVDLIRSRPDLGIEVVGWAGAVANGSLNRESLADSLRSLATKSPVDRIIIAMSDRRGTMPVRELLEARLSGMKVEDASSLLEKIDGKIEVDDLYPSSLIFSDGFRLNHIFLLVRRIVSFLVALVALMICLPIIPIVGLAVKLSSPGPVLFRQKRIGQRGRVFTLYKFRTMHQDAEAKTGAIWAGKDDPRITRIGAFIRKARLDEIPQLWNVFKGDMGFVGPRPERPEFVQRLSDNIPYYHLRHIIRPGLTGWAQVKYQYGASIDESKQKLQYDLYYIKHMTLALDLLIIFETIKTVLFARGAR